MPKIYGGGGGEDFPNEIPRDIALPARYPRGRNPRGDEIPVTSAPP